MTFKTELAEIEKAIKENEESWNKVKDKQEMGYSFNRKPWSEK